MKVPRLFQKQLKRLDRALYIVLDKQRDRFVIRRPDRANNPRDIMVLEDETGEFSRPTYEHIARLYLADMLQNKNLLKDIDEHNEHLEDEAKMKIHRLNAEYANRLTRTNYY